MKYWITFWPQKTPLEDLREGEDETMFLQEMEEVAQAPFAQVVLEHERVGFMVYFGSGRAVIFWCDEDGNYGQTSNPATTDTEGVLMYLENGQGDEFKPTDCFLTDLGVRAALSFWRERQPPQWLEWSQ